MAARRKLSLPRVLAILCLTLFRVGSAVAAGDAPGVVVEVSEDLESKVEAKWVGRLVRLELAEIVLPAPYGATSLRTTPVFFRLTDEGDAIGVELWHRGIYEGKRSVSAAGGERLVARRVALVSAELARNLVRRRQRAAAVQKRAELRARKASLRRRGRPLFARWLLDTQAVVRSLGAETLTAGPGVVGALQFERGPLVSAGIAAQAGVAPRYDQVGPLLVYELSLGAGYQWSVLPAHSVEVGAKVSLAQFNFGRAESASPRERSSSALVPTASLAGAYVARLTPRLGIATGAEVGSSLARVPVADGADAPRIGGLSLGASIGLRFDLDAPSRPL